MFDHQTVLIRSERLAENLESEDRRMSATMEALQQDLKTTRVSDETLRVLLSLPRQERLRISTILLDSLDSPPDDPAEYRQAVREELEWRIEELEAGRASTYTREEFMEIMKRQIQEARAHAADHP